jgi:predicted DNA binding CopG/RHH family protein
MAKNDKNKKKLPDFISDEEFAEFVETHDMADYLDEFEEVKNMKFKRPTKRPITMKVYPYILEEIKRLAAEKGMPYQTLIGQWLAERVSQEQLIRAKGKA